MSKARKQAKRAKKRAARTPHNQIVTAAPSTVIQPSTATSTNKQQRSHQRLQHVRRNERSKRHRMQNAQHVSSKKLLEYHDDLHQPDDDNITLHSTKSKLCKLFAYTPASSYTMSDVQLHSDYYFALKTLPGLTELKFDEIRELFNLPQKLRKRELCTLQLLHTSCDGLSISLNAKYNSKTSKANTADTYINHSSKSPPSSSQQTTPPTTTTSKRPPHIPHIYPFPTTHKPMPRNSTSTSYRLQQSSSDSKSSTNHTSDDDNNSERTSIPYIDSAKGRELLRKCKYWTCIDTGKTTPYTALLFDNPLPSSPLPSYPTPQSSAAEHAAYTAALRQLLNPKRITHTDVSISKPFYNHLRRFHPHKLKRRRWLRQAPHIKAIFKSQPNQHSPTNAQQLAYTEWFLENRPTLTQFFHHPRWTSLKRTSYIAKQKTVSQLLLRLIGGDWANLKSTVINISDAKFPSSGPGGWWLARQLIKLGANVLMADKDFTTKRCCHCQGNNVPFQQSIALAKQALVQKLKRGDNFALREWYNNNGHTISLDTVIDPDDAAMKCKTNFSWLLNSWGVKVCSSAHCRRRTQRDHGSCRNLRILATCAALNIDRPTAYKHKTEHQNQTSKGVRINSNSPPSDSSL